tara:strand:- start:28 stop:903 length:876 start_codon:yes stop_codon:yes gene_type:complete
MKIALSGSSGSIGTLLKKYLAKKHKISTVSFRGKQDINDGISAQRNDVFIHLASLNANLTSESDRLLELDIAKNALRYCKKNEIKSLVFFSTSQVYGSKSLNEKPFKESDPCHSKTLYSRAKLDCEIFLSKECKENNINLIILRSCPFIDLQSNSKIAFLGKLAKNLKISIEFSKANINTRSFLTERNLYLIIDSVLSLIRKSDLPLHKKINIGDRGPVSTNEIIKAIAAAYSIKTIRIRVPKIFELITSKMPLIRNLYQKLVSNHAVDVNLAEVTLGIKLLQTEKSILND